MKLWRVTYRAPWATQDPVSVTEEVAADRLQILDGHLAFLNEDGQCMLLVGRDAIILVREIDNGNSDEETDAGGDGGNGDRVPEVPEN